MTYDLELPKPQIAPCDTCHKQVIITGKDQQTHKCRNVEM